MYVRQHFLSNIAMQLQVTFNFSTLGVPELSIANMEWNVCASTFFFSNFNIGTSTSVPSTEIQ